MAGGRYSQVQLQVQVQFSTGTVYSSRVHSLQVRHKAAPEVSKGNLYINQKKCMCL